jgi:hypothetical protein
MLIISTSKVQLLTDKNVGFFPEISLIEQGVGSRDKLFFRNQFPLSPSLTCKVVDLLPFTIHIVRYDVMTNE